MRPKLLQHGYAFRAAEFGVSSNSGTTDWQDEMGDYPGAKPKQEKLSRHEKIALWVCGTVAGILAFGFVTMVGMGFGLQLAREVQANDDLPFMIAGGIIVWVLVYLLINFTSALQKLGLISTNNKTNE